MGEVVITKSTDGIRIEYMYKVVVIPWKHIKETVEDINIEIDKMKSEINEIIKVL